MSHRRNRPLPVRILVVDLDAPNRMLTCDYHSVLIDVHRHGFKGEYTGDFADTASLQIDSGNQP